MYYFNDLLHPLSNPNLLVQIKRSENSNIPNFFDRRVNQDDFSINTNASLMFKIRCFVITQAISQSKKLFVFTLTIWIKFLLSCQRWTRTENVQELTASIHFPFSCKKQLDWKHWIFSLLSIYRVQLHRPYAEFEESDCSSLYTFHIHS